MSQSRYQLLRGASALCSLSLLFTPAAAHDVKAGRTVAASTEATVAETAMPLDPRFSPDRIKADISFLADDLLEGRDTGTRGYEIAANFVAQRFAALGLKPAGDKGGWMQRIPFQKTEWVDGASGIAIEGPKGSATFNRGTDAVLGLNPNELKFDVSAPLVFVGYGLANERLGLNDYAGLDVKGKIVVLLRGFPEGLPSEAAAYAVSEKARVAQDQGAIGMIQIDTDASSAQRAWARRLQAGSAASVKWVQPDGKAYDSTPGIRVSGALSDKGAEALFAGAARSYAQIRKDAARKGARPKGLELKTSARLFGESKASQVTSPNVIAVLPGSDPTLAAEHVVLSAHLDHTGISPARAGEAADADRINNGAMDNAAGVATMLEVARALTSEPVKPRRSVLFLVVTAEEKGLLGTEYFARYPTVPIPSLIGNVNLDMPVLTYPFTDLIAFGADHSTMGGIVAEAVKPMQVKLSPDPMPEETIFVRSDHYRLVQQGVPAVFLVTGYANGGEAASKLFEEKYYHQPGDDLNLPINWRAGARFAEANYRITRMLTDSDARPLWFTGDLFGDAFAPNAPKAPASTAR
jgi:hypothetical protein